MAGISTITPTQNVGQQSFANILQSTPDVFNTFVNTSIQNGRDTKAQRASQEEALLGTISDLDKQRFANEIDLRNREERAKELGQNQGQFEDQLGLDTDKFAQKAGQDLIGNEFAERELTSREKSAEANLEFKERQEGRLDEQHQFNVEQSKAQKAQLAKIAERDDLNEQQKNDLTQEVGGIVSHINSLPPSEQQEAIRVASQDASPEGALELMRIYGVNKGGSTHQFTEGAKTRQAKRVETARARYDEVKTSGTGPNSESDTEEGKRAKAEWQREQAIMDQMEGRTSQQAPTDNFPDQAPQQSDDPVVETQGFADELAGPSPDTPIPNTEVPVVDNTPGVVPLRESLAKTKEDQPLGNVFDAPTDGVGEAGSLSWVIQQTGLGGKDLSGINLTPEGLTTQINSVSDVAFEQLDEGSNAFGRALGSGTGDQQAMKAAKKAAANYVYGSPTKTVDPEFDNKRVGVFDDSPAFKQLSVKDRDKLKDKLYQALIDAGMDNARRRFNPTARERATDTAKVKSNLDDLTKSLNE